MNCRADSMWALVILILFQALGCDCSTKQWMTKDGRFFNYRFYSSIEVAKTPSARAKSFDVIKVLLRKMLQHVHRGVWDNLVRSKASAGVFSRSETTCAFPEYAKYKDTEECKGSCSGLCKVTCTSHNRKFCDLPGLGGIRATVDEENALCTDKDGYHKHYNIFVHEFAHTVMHYLSLPQQQLIRKAYKEAKRKKTWGLRSYAMSSPGEYWAQATGVWFGVNQQHWSRGTGKMNGSPVKLCRTEASCRRHLERRDPNLAKVLRSTFSPWGQPGNMTICPVGVSNCIDKREHCNHWAEIGLCDKRSDKRFMHFYCRESCGLCTTGTRRRTWL